ncbi:hypothetical protein AB870_25880 [Pandoraea faecigallinarum]|uniref:DUF2306 domain-containing protein n=1 Tax=Pandoraea faecigallinarum TaxID=656179 RepID=A0A173GZS3_9BURK|nr:DUF2306 domain-containing protein [Pandoraea faecigallinarum]ANI21700.1 hypothetical protein AB870_25880 [Pandoraea faecigallinarum]
MATMMVMHVGTAGVAILLGVGVLLLPRGTPRHRWMGRWWALAMVATAVTSFGIRELGKGHFSWLHGLSVYVLINLALAVNAVRRGNVRAHRRQMLGLYAGLVIAGVAAVAVPGRPLNNALTRMWQHGTPQGTLARAGSTHESIRVLTDIPVPVGTKSGEELLVAKDASGMRGARE